MTDNTQPEAGSTHIIRYALEMGLLWIGRDKVREALDALDTLEAQLEAIREANMQLVRTGDDAFMLVPYKVATPQSDSVLEDAARWQALESCVLEINGGKDWMSIVLKDDAKPEPFLKGMLSDKLAALAARKQGGAT